VKPRAFVVMPFGDSVQVGPNGRDLAELVDFRKVYSQLLEPALKRAGCIPYRADDAIFAGDIRTDMFFELATADFVIAEISALNPNVFYELGVRNGLCPRGILLVRGNWPWSRPFDIAPDRTFTYNSEYFVPKNNSRVPDGDIQKLATALQQSMNSDLQTIGSPVYSHLQGLKPPDMTGIQTSKARYFTALHDDWMERVRRAQDKAQPGHILTLAEEAPTPVHRTKILYEAAKALIGLCCYKAAQQVLEEILSLEPSNAEARVQLCLVLERSEPTQAEDQIRNVLHAQKDDPSATDLLGQVYRHLWRLSWQDLKRPSAPPPISEIRGRAKENSSLAALAYQNFWRTQQTHPEAYFSGFNAILLLALIDDLYENKRPSDFGSVETEDSIRTVRFAADCARSRALLKGDHEEQFWSTTSLSGLALIEGKFDVAQQLIRDACAFPQTSLFQMESLKHRLELLDELGFQSNFVQTAITIVDGATKARSKLQFGKVVVFYGGASDTEDVGTPARQQGFETLINGVLDRCNVGEGDLGLTGGIRMPDLLFAELCRKRGATVQILLLEPSPREISGGLWPVSPDDGAARFQTLAQDQKDQMDQKDQEFPKVSILSHEEELGPPLNPQNAKSRHNRWLMNTARFAAERSKERKLLGIVLWNDNTVPEDTEDAYYEHPAFFTTTIRRSLNYRGQVEIIRPSIGENTHVTIAAGQ
jgi:hypothetical protein